MVRLCFFRELWNVVIGYLSLFSVVEVLFMVCALSAMTAIFSYLVRREYDKERQ